MRPEIKGRRLEYTLNATYLLINLAVVIIHSTIRGEKYCVSEANAVVIMIVGWERKMIMIMWWKQKKNSFSEKQFV